MINVIQERNKNWDYAKDIRSNDQILADFRKGKEAQRKIIERLKTYTTVNFVDKDKFGILSRYKPDIEMEWHGSMIPVEIKYTDKVLRMVEWKKNQWDYALSVGGRLLQISAGRCALISPRDEHFYREKGYCNKEAMVFRPQWFISFGNIFV